MSLDIGIKVETRKIDRIIAMPRDLDKEDTNEEITELIFIIHQLIRSLCHPRSVLGMPVHLKHLKQF